jgi:GR25 family glycosyltransferase involved in LPS biosynthesis
MSHLTAVRTAYLSGAEVALIAEDDIGPYLMPYWTVGVGDLLKALKDNDTSWDTVMLWWATEAGSGPRKDATWVGENLIRSPYLWGASAYLISRQGMEKVMKKHFPEGGADTPLVLTFEGEVVIDGTGYYGELMKENYIVYPAMFITHSKQSTIQTDPWHFGFHTKMGVGHWMESIRRWQSIYYPSLKRR